MLISTSTSTEESERRSTIAVLPVGSFEQHGSHLPLSTDTLIAAAVSRRVANAYDLLLLPPITIGCSHEHTGFSGTVSVSSSTLYAMVTDIRESLKESGVSKLAIVNGHGGNYVLSHVVQEGTAGEASPSMVLFPRSEDWAEARSMADLETSNHADMHGGEAETSILLHEAPDVVRSNYASCDEQVDDRRHLLSVGVRWYSKSGVIGFPSLASAEKGAKLLDAFTKLFQAQYELLNR